MTPETASSPVAALSRPNADSRREPTEAMPALRALRARPDRRSGSPAHDSREQAGSM